MSLQINVIKQDPKQINIYIKLFAIDHRLLGEFLAALWSCNISNHDEDNNYSKKDLKPKREKTLQIRNPAGTKAI